MSRFLLYAKFLPKLKQIIEIHTILALCPFQWKDNCNKIKYNLYHFLFSYVYSTTNITMHKLKQLDKKNVSSSHFPSCLNDKKKKNK